MSSPEYQIRTGSGQEDIDLLLQDPVMYSEAVKPDPVNLLEASEVQSNGTLRALGVIAVTSDVLRKDLKNLTQLPAQENSSQLAENSNEYPEFATLNEEELLQVAKHAKAAGNWTRYGKATNSLADKISNKMSLKAVGSGHPELEELVGDVDKELFYVVPPRESDWLHPLQLAKLRIDIENEIRNKTWIAHTQALNRSGEFNRALLVKEVTEKHIGTYFGDSDEGSGLATASVRKAVNDMLNMPMQEFMVLANSLKQKEARGSLLENYSHVFDEVNVAQLTEEIQKDLQDEAKKLAENEGLKELPESKREELLEDIKNQKIKGYLGKNISERLEKKINTVVSNRLKRLSLERRYKLREAQGFTH